MSQRLGPVLEQLAPPALLTYFAWAWRRCTFSIGLGYFVKGINRPVFGALYALLSTLLIPPVTMLFLRLYFLPSSQSVPPLEPPMEIQKRRIIFECKRPLDGEPFVVPPFSQNVSFDRSQEIDLVERCWKGKCKGRWKPARTRHCSDCQTCRVGFDHHCAFFANCLTIPYVPSFLLAVLTTPIIIFILSLPLYYPLSIRALAAWRVANSDPSAAWWWDAWWTWIVAGGPVGRWGGGLMLGWLLLDRQDGGGTAELLKFEMGALLGFGQILALFTAGLAYSTIIHVKTGILTVDRARAKSLARAEEALARLSSPDLANPHLRADLMRFGNIRWFFVPFQTTTSVHEGSSSFKSHDTDGSGVVLPTLPGERPYDLGAERNWELIFGDQGWKWALPWKQNWNQIFPESVLFNWPISSEVKERLELQAAKLNAKRMERPKELMDAQSVDM